MNFYSEAPFVVNFVIKFVFHPLRGEHFMKYEFVYIILNPAKEIITNGSKNRAQRLRETRFQNCVYSLI